MLEEPVFLILASVVIFGERLIESLTPLANPLIGWLSKVTKLQHDYLMMWFSWLIIGVFVYMTGINLFISYFTSALFGRVVTCLVGAGGSNLLHDIWSQKINTSSTFRTHQ